MVLITLAGLALLEKRKAARSQELERLEEENRRAREEEAFNELQAYANFQNYLSSEVLDDLDAEDATNGPPRYSFETKGKDLEFQLEPSYSSYDHGVKRQLLLPSPEQSHELPSPLVIPQYEDPSTGARSWNRAYSQTLMSCGIPQDSFFDFLDSFNSLLRTSPQLSAINIATPDLSSAIPLAIHEAKIASASPEDGEEADVFLDRANEDLFSPNGLLAMIISSQPDNNSTILSVDFNKCPPSFASSLTSRPPNRNSYSAHEMHETSHSQQHFQNHDHVHPTSEVDRPSRGSRALSTESLQSLVSTISSAHDRRKDSQRMRKRRHALSGKSEKRPGSAASLSSAGADTTRRGSESSSIWREEEEEGPAFGLEVQAGALYLVLVNDPEGE